MIPFYPYLNGSNTLWAVGMYDAYPSNTCAMIEEGDVVTIINVVSNVTVAVAEYYNYSDASGNPYTSLSSLRSTTASFFVKAPTDAGGGDLSVKVDKSSISQTVGTDVTAIPSLSLFSKSTRLPYPFASSVVKTVSNPMYDAILDVEIIGGNKNWRVGIMTLERAKSTYHYIRLAVYDSNGIRLTSVGSSGVIGSFQYTNYVEPSVFQGRILDEIQFNTLYDSSVTKIKMLIDWSKIPTGVSYGLDSYTSSGLDPKVFELNSLHVYRDQIFKYLPRAEELTWARTNTFSLGNVSEVVVSAEIYGVTDKTKRYGVELYNFNPTAGTRSFFGIREFAADGTAGTRVALWDNTNYTPPTVTNGKQLATLNLSQANSSGITATITVDWAKVPTSGTGWQGTYWYSNSFKVTDGEFSYRTYKDTKGISGAVTQTFQVDGIDCQLITPSAYTKDGAKSKLCILVHGNGQAYTYAGSTNFKNYCAAHNIAIATTKAQDQTAYPFITSNVGWGNREHVKRYVRLYDYLISNYNFQPNIILVGVSMGGLAVGQILYNKSLPVAVTLLVGPVPDLSYIFAHGGSTRQQIIRAAYGMASDGSQDASLETYIRGFDWFDMGLLDISGTKYKFGFPRTYINVGTGDSTFTTDFGGSTKYNEVITALRNAGTYVEYHELPSVSHADDTCFDRFITDGILAKELGN